MSHTNARYRSEENPPQMRQKYFNRRYFAKCETCQHCASSYKKSEITTREQGAGAEESEAINPNLSLKYDETSHKNSLWLLGAGKKFDSNQKH